MKLLAMVWSLAICFASWRVDAQPALFGNPTPSARAVLELTWEPSFDEIHEVAAGVTRRLGQPGDPWSGQLYATASNVTVGRAQFELATYGEDRQAGVKAIQAFADWLGKEAKAQHDRTMKQREEAYVGVRQSVQEAANEVRRVDSEISAVRAELRKATRRVDVSREGISAAATGLEEEAQKVSIELRAREARKQMMERVVAEMAKRAKEEAKADPIMAELEGILAMRQRELQLAEKMHQAATVSMSEVEAMRAKVAEAKIRLLERREQAAKGAGTDAVKGLNDSLLMMSIDIAEQQARLEAVRETLASFERATELLERVDQAMERRQEAAQGLAERRAKAREVEMKMGSFRQPTISLRGLEARPADAKKGE